jgi:hypothetical protein
MTSGQTSDIFRSFLSGWPSVTGWSAISKRSVAVLMFFISFFYSTVVMTPTERFAFSKPKNFPGRNFGKNFLVNNMDFDRFVLR